MARYTLKTVSKKIPVTNPHQAQTTENAGTRKPVRQRQSVPPVCLPMRHLLLEVLAPRHPMYPT